MGYNSFLVLIAILAAVIYALVIDLISRALFYWYYIPFSDVVFPRAGDSSKYLAWALSALFAW